MKRLTLLTFAALALASCSPGIIAGAMDGDSVAAPSTIADATTLDETLALRVENTYRASRLAMELAVDQGQLKGAAATKAAALDNRAYAAVQATRAAYNAGNADSYVNAGLEAIRSVSAVLAVVGAGK